MHFAIASFSRGAHDDQVDTFSFAAHEVTTGALGSVPVIRSRGKDAPPVTVKLPAVRAVGTVADQVFPVTVALTVWPLTLMETVAALSVTVPVLMSH